jgi:hypothetical protein
VAGGSRFRKAPGRERDRKAPLAGMPDRRHAGGRRRVGGTARLPTALRILGGPAGTDVRRGTPHVITPIKRPLAAAGFERGVTPSFSALLRGRVIALLAWDQAGGVSGPWRQNSLLQAGKKVKAKATLSIAASVRRSRRSEKRLHESTIHTSMFAEATA